MRQRPNYLLLTGLALLAIPCWLIAGWLGLMIWTAVGMICLGIIKGAAGVIDNSPCMCNLECNQCTQFVVSCPCQGKCIDKPRMPPQSPRGA